MLLPGMPWTKSRGHSTSDFDTAAYHHTAYHKASLLHITIPLQLHIYHCIFIVQYFRTTSPLFGNTESHIELTSTFLNILQGNNTTLHILTLLPTSMTKSFAIHYTTFATLHIALPLQPLPHCNTTSRYHGIAFNIQPSTPQHLTPIPLCPHPIQ